MIMRLRERIAYGRAIRDHALTLIEAHGMYAAELARDAGCETGLPEAQRRFWLAVAARIERLETARAGAIPAWAA